MAKAVAPAEEFLDGCLKEGTDQGWTLHSMHQDGFDAFKGGIASGIFKGTTIWFTFIWETND